MPLAGVSSQADDDGALLGLDDQSAPADGLRRRGSHLGDEHLRRDQPREDPENLAQAHLGHRRAGQGGLQRRQRRERQVSARAPPSWGPIEHATTQQKLTLNALRVGGEQAGMFDQCGVNQSTSSCWLGEAGGVR